jgi:hypothetical protein
MEDPLINFDWLNLYQAYDDKCRGFNIRAPQLQIFGSKELNRPNSDRELYYKLLDLFSVEQRNSQAEPIRMYEALLYWKLYSQNAAIFNLKNKWLPMGSEEREDAQERIVELLKTLPPKLEKSPSQIIELIRSFNKFKLPGMASADAIPVRTTFLHFIYPNAVPIFDQMVLRAIGLWEQGANHRYPVLEKYLPIAWDLADKYATEISSFKNESPVPVIESPIRIIDMALWVNRGRVKLTNPIL